MDIKRFQINELQTQTPLADAEQLASKNTDFKHGTGY